MKTIIQRIETSLKRLGKSEKFDFAIIDIRYEYPEHYAYGNPELIFKIQIRKKPKPLTVKKKK